MIQLVIQFAKRFASRYRYPILAGFLIGTSYIPFPPWALFFCLSPLLHFWWSEAVSVRECLIAGWITQFILNMIGFHWIAYTASEFGHFPIYGGLLVLLGFAAIAHLYYPIAGAVAFFALKRLRISGPAALATYALVFALTDRFFTKIFPWHLGYPWLWAGWPGVQVSDVLGFEGLYYVTIAVNALLTWSLVEGLLKRSPSPSEKRRAWAAALVAGLLISVVNLAGIGREKPWQKTDAELRVLAVQGNIGNFDKYMAELHENFGIPIVQKYVDLSRKASAEFSNAHVLNWPETAFPRPLDRDFELPLAQQVRGLARELNLPILAGGYSAQYGTAGIYNGFFYVDAGGRLLQRPYRKTILLVFGETFPFSEYIPYMDKFFPEQGAFARGAGPMVWNLDLDGRERLFVKIGPQICYEGLYPWFSSAMSKAGAQVFANVTNDSWFWKPFEPNQHLYMTLARALEFRRPLFRSTNTGITTAMLASGEILQKSPIGEEWWGLLKIPYQTNPAHTIYERYGHLWPWILAFALVLTLAMGKWIGVGFERGKESRFTERIP